MPRDERYQPRTGPPRPLLDKLGVKPDSRISTIGIRDEAFLEELRGRARDVSSRAREGSDLIFLQVDRPEEFRRLEQLRGCIKPEGAVWVITPKRTRSRPIRPGLSQAEVIEEAKRAGLIDNKSSAFSETHTALRLVIPKSRRLGK